MITKRIILLLALLCFVSTLIAMPTREEIVKAQPLVHELMRKDIEAVKRHEKTSEQVGDSAMELARQTQITAEKYLLLTVAFEQYMNAGTYEKANVAIISLRKMVPDWELQEEFEFLDRALRHVGIAKGGAVRERYEALKKKRQYLLQLKKVIMQAKARPNDNKLQFQIAAYCAVLDKWPDAIDAFLRANNAACAAAARLEKAKSPPAKIADAWWATADIKPDFLSEAIRAHAIEFYNKALEDKTFKGLQRVVATRRIEEYIRDAKINQKSQAGVVGVAKTTGVALVGVSVRNNNGILSGFTSSSYAKIRYPFAPKDATVEAVMEFTTGETIGGTGGLLVGLGAKNGFSPFYISSGHVLGFLSSDGSTWNIAKGVDLGITLKPRTTYRVKCSWNGKVYTWWLWSRNNWSSLKTLPSALHVFNGLELQFGTNRGIRDPFDGTINLNDSYICVGGKLWWEGVKGAYMNMTTKR